VRKVEQLLERWRQMVYIVNQEQRIEKECRHNGIDFNVVMQITDSTHWDLQKTFDFCLRNKEAMQEWPCQKIL